VGCLFVCGGGRERIAVGWIANMQGTEVLGERVFGSNPVRLKRQVDEDNRRASLSGCHLRRRWIRRCRST